MCSALYARVHGVGESFLRLMSDFHSLPVKTPLELAGNDEVKAAFVKHVAKGGQAVQPSE